jgi:hypothetical protein
MGFPSRERFEQGLHLLAAGNGEGLLEADLGLGCIRRCLTQQQGTLEPIGLHQDNTTDTSALHDRVAVPLPQQAHDIARLVNNHGE